MLAASSKPLALDLANPSGRRIGLRQHTRHAYGCPAAMHKLSGFFYAYDFQGHAPEIRGMSRITLRFGSSHTHCLPCHPLPTSTP